MKPKRVFQGSQIKDGRNLFGIEREEKNYIIFAFNGENQLSGVSVQFPMKSTGDYGTLISKLETYFGTGESLPQTTGAIVVQWAEDGGIKISLIMIPGVFSNELLFNIAYTKAISINKEGLGF